MGIFTKLTSDDMARLTANFPALPRSTFKSQGIALGTVNTYYRLRYATGETYYLKIDEVAEERRLKNEIRIFENLHACAKRLSFTVPYPLESTRGKKYVPFAKKFALILPEVEGISFFGKDLTPKKLSLIGKAMSEWHSLPADPRIHEHRFCHRGQKLVFKEIRSKLKLKHPRLYNFISAKLVELEKTAPKREKFSLIHADLFAENILWTKGHLNGILDLDAAGLGSPLFDIGVCLHALCHDGSRFRLEKIRAFFKGYFKNRAPSSHQKKYFKYYLNLSAMRFLLTRLRDFELASRQAKVAPFKDYREYERRFEEIDSLPIELSQKLLYNPRQR